MNMGTGRCNGCSKIIQEGGATIVLESRDRGSIDDQVVGIAGLTGKSSDRGMLDGQAKDAGNLGLDGYASDERTSLARNEVPGGEEEPPTGTSTPTAPAIIGRVDLCKDCHARFGSRRSSVIGSLLEHARPGGNGGSGKNEGTLETYTRHLERRLRALETEKRLLEADFKRRERELQPRKKKLDDTPNLTHARFLKGIIAACPSCSSLFSDGFARERARLARPSERDAASETGHASKAVSKEEFATFKEQIREKIDGIKNALERARDALGRTIEERINEVDKKLDTLLEIREK